MHMDLTLVATDELLAQAERNRNGTAEASSMKNLRILDAAPRRPAGDEACTANGGSSRRRKSAANLLYRPKYRNPSRPRRRPWTGRGKAPAWVDVVGREACLITVDG
jgi:DNA-binding protein H-NS